MDGKVFSQETKDLIVDVVEEVVKVPAWAEPFDGMAFKFLVNFIDKQGDKYIPDSMDAAINEAITLALQGSYEQAAVILGEEVDKLVDIPYLDDKTEALVFTDGVRFVVSMVRHWIESKKAS